MLEFVVVVPVVPVVAPEEVEEPLPLEALLFMPAPPCEVPDVVGRPEDEPEVSELVLVPPVPLSLEPLQPAKKPAAINAKRSCLLILPNLSFRQASLLLVSR